jgi:integrase
LAEFVFGGGHVLPAVVPRERRTLLELLDDYLESIKPPVKAEGTWTHERLHLGHLKRFLLQRGLEKLTAGELTFEFFEDFKRLRVDRATPFTVNKYLVTFRNVLNYAIDLGLVTRDVLTRVKRFKKAKTEAPPFMTGVEIEDQIRRGSHTDKEKRALRRARILTWDEIRDLLEQLRGASSHVPVAIAAYTGARKGEISRLTWADVNLEGSPFVVLRSRKQSRTTREKTRRVQILPPLLRILKEHQELREEQAISFVGLNRGVI